MENIWRGMMFFNSAIQSVLAQESKSLSIQFSVVIRNSGMIRASAPQSRSTKMGYPHNHLRCRSMFCNLPRASQRSIHTLHPKDDSQG